MFLPDDSILNQIYIYIYISTAVLIDCRVLLVICFVDKPSGCTIYLFGGREHRVRFPRKSRVNLFNNIFFFSFYNELTKPGNATR